MKILPVYNENTKQYFVSKDYLKPYLLDEDGTGNKIITSALRFNNEFVFLAITQQLNNDIKDIDINLDKIYFGLHQLYSKTNPDTDKSELFYNTEVFYIDANSFDKTSDSNLSLTKFKTKENYFQPDLLLDYSISFPIVWSLKTIGGSESEILETYYSLNKSEIHTEIKIKGCINIKTGICKLMTEYFTNNLDLEMFPNPIYTTEKEIAKNITMSLLGYTLDINII